MGRVDREDKVRVEKGGELQGENGREVTGKMEKIR